jgi:hypothetical protein
MLYIIGTVIIAAALCYLWKKANRRTIPENDNPTTTDVVGEPGVLTKELEDESKIVEELEYQHEDIMVPKPDAKPKRKKKAASTKESRTSKKVKD